MKKDNISGKRPRNKFKKKSAGETGQSFDEIDSKQLYRGAGHWISNPKEMGKDVVNHQEERQSIENPKD